MPPYQPGTRPYTVIIIYTSLFTKHMVAITTRKTKVVKSTSMIRPVKITQLCIIIKFITLIINTEIQFKNTIRIHVAQ